MLWDVKTCVSDFVKFLLLTRVCNKNECCLKLVLYMFVEISMIATVLATSSPSRTASFISLSKSFLIFICFFS